MTTQIQKKLLMPEELEILEALNNNDGGGENEAHYDCLDLDYLEEE